MRSPFRIVLLLAFVVLTSDAFAQSGTISTVAGTGAAGYGGDGSPGTSAQLNGPFGVAVDSAGNLYIADWYNHAVRKVAAGSGVITTVAGNGFAGMSGDGGLAVNSNLNGPEDVAVDAAGNIYIADSLNNRIRKINPSGIITTIAGTGIPGYNGEGPALARNLNDPAGLALDSSGNLFIGEQSSHRVRKLILATGEISTLAGTGTGGYSGDGGPATSAMLYNPVQVATDAAGNVYIADYSNNRIRKVNMATGMITTVAGSSPAGVPGGFSGDGGPATSALLNNPAGVAVDASGNIYISDAINKRVRMVSVANGVITTLAGGGTNGDGCSSVTASLEHPLDLAVTASALFVADFSDNRVRMVSLTGNPTPPTLTAISPSSGIPGVSLRVTLTGSGFSMSTGSGAGCVAGAVAVTVSGAGVTPSNVTVMSDGSMSATFIVAPNATLGPRDVTVSNARGMTEALEFRVTAPIIPRPRITSITPASGLRGSTTSVTFVGTDFGLGTGVTSVVVSGTAISVSNVNVASTTSLTASFNVAPGASLGTYPVSVSTAGGASNDVSFTVVPQGPVITYGLPSILNPTEQVPLQLSMATASPEPISGQLSLTFIPNANSSTDDPNVMFISTQASGKNSTFTFPSNATSAQFSLSNAVVQAGTVAGTIRLSMTGVQVGGVSVAPLNSTFDVTIPRLPPTITNVRIINRTVAGFDVEITGYSTSRDITAATFTFEEAAGANLLTVELKPEVITQFTTYYESPESIPVGSAFVYVQPFNVTQGDVNAVASVTVTLTNPQGTSQPKTAN